MKNGLMVFLLVFFVVGCGDDDVATLVTGPDEIEDAASGEEGSEGSTPGDDVITGTPLDVTTGEGGEGGEGDGAANPDGEQQNQCETDEDCGQTPNECAAFTCEEGTCVQAYVENGTPCGTEQAPPECVESYGCMDGACEAINVADGVTCTSDEEVGECQVAACSAGACTVGADAEKEGTTCEGIGDTGLCATPQCSEGACSAIPLEDGIGCDDGTVCTQGATCEAGDCKSAIDVPCDDGSLCTSNDVCLDAECVGESVNCDDGDECTIDSCDGATGECSNVDDTLTPGCPFYDGDGDDIFAKDDNCPEVPNPEQIDWNGDGVGDACAVNACLNTQDVDVLIETKETFAANGGQGNTPLQEAIYTCMPQCSGGGSDCSMAECIGSETGLSMDCSGCLAEKFACQLAMCSDVCVAGVDWSDCEACVEEKCGHYEVACTGLGQAKSGNGCPENTEEYCDGTCWPAGWFDLTVGNGQCDAPMSCESKGFDGGDCGMGGGDDPNPCGDGGLPDCVGGCSVEESFGNGSCEPFNNCAETNWDGGDCEPNCPGGEFVNCEGTCSPIAELDNKMSNGECDIELNCALLSNDGGDCGMTSCGAGEVQNCDGQCVAFSAVGEELGNGSCDISLACEDWYKDVGDCDGACLNSADIVILDGKTTEDLSGDLQVCLFQCGPSASSDCAVTCIQEQLGISTDCAACFGDFGNCLFQNCGLPCQSNPGGDQCIECTEVNCQGPLEECTGLLF